MLSQGSVHSHSHCVSTLIQSHCVSIIFSHACIIAELERFLNIDLTISGDIFVHDWRIPHFQHTPVILMVITIWSIAIHDDISEVCEHFPLEWFGKKISNHVMCVTILYVYFLALYSIFDEEVSNVDVSGALST